MKSRAVIETPPWLRRFTILVAASTLFLIFAGAMVTSTGSGLAVPDWPLSYGMVLPPMVGGIFYEHGHRMIAATVGFLTVLQAIWLQIAEPKRFLRRLGWSAVGAVIAQGVLGGLTVIFLLPPAISIAHAGLAEIFLCLNVAIAFSANRPVKMQSFWLVAIVYAQILLGAATRHTGATAVLYAHLIGAVIVLVAVRRSRILTALVCAQFALGGLTLWTGKHPLITSLHVVTGAATLATALMLALQSPLPRAGEGAAKRRVRVLADYLELSKSRIVAMVLMTTAAGFVVAGDFNALVLINTLIGTALVAGGTNALNQYAERNLDAQMRRTSHRPLPAGRITPRAALIFSTAIAIIGTIYLAVAVNPLAAFLGAFTLTSYIFVYTPLKRYSTACTVIGAIPGAVPPLIGYAAAAGTLHIAAWIVFAVVFLWQLPHFMAISWIYREDYGRAGFKMLSVVDSDGRAVAREALLYSLALVPIAVAPAVFGMAGLSYGIVAAIASLALLAWAVRFLFERSPRRARALFMTSNFYLLVMTVLFATMVRG